jgi:hypothetical protein
MKLTPQTLVEGRRNRFASGGLYSAAAQLMLVRYTDH